MSNVITIPYTNTELAVFTGEEISLIKIPKNIFQKISIIIKDGKKDGKLIIDICSKDIGDFNENEELKNLGLTLEEETDNWIIGGKISRKIGSQNVDLMIFVENMQFKLSVKIISTEAFAKWYLGVYICTIVIGFFHSLDLFGIRLISFDCFSSIEDSEIKYIVSAYLGGLVVIITEWIRFILTLVHFGYYEEPKWYNKFLVFAAAIFLGAILVWLVWYINSYDVDAPFFALVSLILGLCAELIKKTIINHKDIY